MSFPIRARLTVWYVTILALILAALGAFLIVRLRADLVRGVDAGLDTRAAQISLGLQNGCEGEFQDVSDASLVGLPLGESGAQLLGSHGTVVESTGDEVARGRLLTPDQTSRVLAGERVRATISTGPDAEPFRVLGARLTPGVCPGAIVVVTSLDDVDRSVHRLVLLLLIAGPAALAAAGVGGWVLARRALRPVARMTIQASEIGGAGLDERIDVPTTADELQRLAVTLNGMLDRLERGVDEKKRFVADASHELRTPLAVMSFELDVSLRSDALDPIARGVLASAREEVERMNGIVENLLTLARLDEGGLGLLHERVNLARVVEAGVQRIQPIAHDRGVRIQTHADDVSVVGDDARLEQVVSNLVGNAVKYSEVGEEITLTVERRDGEAVCSVADRGPGVESDIASHLFERFVRGDLARSRVQGGAGLGLAIAREIIEAHGGRIWVGPRPGGGSIFAFAVPLASAEV